MEVVSTFVFLVCVGVCGWCVMAFLSSRRHKQTSSPEVEWNTEASCWDVRSYLAFIEFIRSPSMSANYVQQLWLSLPPHLQELYRDTTSFLSSQVLSLEGPEHRAIHKLLSTFFSGPRMQRLESVIEETATRLLLHIFEKHADGTPWDLVQQYAHPLPLSVIVRLIGFEDSDKWRLKEWTDAIEVLFGGADPLPQRFESCHKAVEEYQQWLRLFLDIHPQLPEDCLLQVLLDAHRDQLITYEQLSSNLLFVVAAGHETTSSLISNSVLLLLQNPTQLRFLMEQLVESTPHSENTALSLAVEELIRLSTPVKHLYRQAMAPMVVGSSELGSQVNVESGASVRFLLSDLNQDGVLFDSPSANAARLELTRASASKNVSFGFGRHVCVGRHLGKMEARVALTTLWTRCPQLQLAMHHASAVEWLPLSSLHALKQLLVTH